MPRARVKGYLRRLAGSRKQVRVRGHIRHLSYAKKRRR